MKKILNKSLLFLFLLVPVVLITTPGFSSETGVTQRIEKASGNKGQDKKTGIPIPLPVNAVKVDGNYQGGTFYTEARKDEIERFRCTSCHNNKDVKIQNAAKMAHGNIKVDHGGQNEPLACFTCHNKNDRDYLNTSKDPKIDPDHVYKMCGECHFRQKKDWIGGAHGKRVTYWDGERVVKNCTSCHDPHSPRFKKRWPATYSAPFENKQGE